MDLGRFQRALAGYRRPERQAWALATAIISTAMAMPVLVSVTMTMINAHVCRDDHVYSL